MSQWVHTSEHEQKRYTLLQPGSHPARTGPAYQLQANWRDVEWVCESAAQSQFLAVDFETQGGDYSADISIVGIGLAWSEGSCYFHWDNLSKSNRASLIHLIAEHSGLLAHNVYFDGGVFLQCLKYLPTWHACTYSLLAHLANEGHPDQSWGLKSAMVELLGWESSNETELDRWLVLNEHYKGNKRLDNTPEYLNAEFEAGKLKPDKSQMWQAPAEILGKYCVLDAEACYLLYTEVLRPVLSQFPGLQDSFRDTMYLINLLIEQKIHGIPVNRDGLVARRDELLRSMQQLEQQFLVHPDTSLHIHAMETAMISEIQAVEPDRLKKNGDISKNWLNWKARLDAAWKGELPGYRFNIQSGPQLRDLLYNRMGMEVRVRTETAGEPGVGVKALKLMGEIGSILVDRGYAQKELSYIQDYIDRTMSRPSIHPSFRTPGTMTGRLSSKEPNVQQIPKSKAVMSLFHARPGHVWVDLDFSALEPVVLTEFSRDSNMMQIYGNGRPTNDIYLFVSAFIPSYSEQVRATGYDPFNPTPESLARAKKECKGIRNICKTVVLACQYGAGVNKVMQVLEQDDVFLPYEEVELIHSTYWDTFAGVQDFRKSLEYEWRRNKGWIENGMGRPMCVPQHMLKDVLNRFVQSTGHDILVRYVRIYIQLLTAADIPWSPLIIDWHDSSAVEVPEKFREQTAEIMQQGVALLNEELQGTIQLRGEPDIGYNLAEIKKPEE